MVLVSTKNETKKSHPAISTGWRYAQRRLSGLFGSRLCEVMVIGHTSADVGVEIPFDGTLGESLLRLDDLLEQRIIRRFFSGCVIVRRELPLEYRVRSLVEL